MSDFRIFVDKSWYVNVDDKGHAKEFCAEGALGCVVPLRDIASPKDARRALKIPRLLADTWRENAFVDSKTEAERRIVSRVHGMGGNFGLVNADIRARRAAARLDTLDLTAMIRDTTATLTRLPHTHQQVNDALPAPRARWSPSSSLSSVPSSIRVRRNNDVFRGAIPSQLSTERWRAP